MDKLERKKPTTGYREKKWFFERQREFRRAKGVLEGFH